jgi:hypothetical protein
MASKAALMFHVSWQVKTSSRSTPPSTNKAWLRRHKNSCVAWRASSAARLLSSYAWAANPYSARTSGVLPKLLVSMMSDPASRCFRRMSAPHPASAHQVFVAAFQCSCAKVRGNQVALQQHGPIAPSSAKIRRASSSRRTFADSVRLHTRSRLLLLCRKCPKTAYTTERLCLGCTTILRRFHSESNALHQTSVFWREWWVCSAETAKSRCYTGFCRRIPATHEPTPENS